MDDGTVLIALASAPIAVWLGLLIAGLIWAGRRVALQCRVEMRVVGRAFRIRTLRTAVDGVGALAKLGWLLSLALFVAPLLLTVGPLLLAILGLQMTEQLVKVGP